MAVEQRYQHTVPTVGTVDSGAVAEAGDGGPRPRLHPDGARGRARCGSAAGPATPQGNGTTGAAEPELHTLRALTDPGPLTSGNRTRDAARKLGALTELSTELPHLLLELSSDLLACQNERPSAGNEPGDSPPSPAIGAARFALAEATSAALVLVRRLNDAGRNLADLTDAT